MKLSELIAELTTIEQEHGDVLVIMSSDSEGNNYSEEAWVDVGFFNEEGFFSDEVEGTVPCVCFWP